LTIYKLPLALTSGCLMDKAFGFSQIKNKTSFSALAKAYRKIVFTEVWLKPFVD
jgi:hypothetical protein